MSWTRRVRTAPTHRLRFSFHVQQAFENIMHVSTGLAAVLPLHHRKGHSYPVTSLISVCTFGSQSLGIASNAAGLTQSLRSRLQWRIPETHILFHFLQHVHFVLHILLVMLIEDLDEFCAIMPSLLCCRSLRFAAQAILSLILTYCSTVRNEGEY